MLILNGTLYGKESHQSFYLPIYTYGICIQAVRNLEKGVCARVYAVGSPRIGKSFGLLWTLLILARKGEIILLKYAKEKMGYLFVRLSLENTLRNPRRVLNALNVKLSKIAETSLFLIRVKQDLTPFKDPQLRPSCQHLLTLVTTRR